MKNAAAIGASAPYPTPGPGRPSLFPTIGPATMASLFHGVQGAPAGPADPSAWDDELPAILAQRLSGLALAAARSRGVELTAHTDWHLREAQLATTARALAVESTALEVIAIFERRGIPVVVTKGPGIADAYPQPAQRPYGDVDVLVPPATFEAAMQTLHELSFRPYVREGEPRAYFDRRCREGVNLVREDGGSIDLHHHVPPWVWGDRLTFEELASSSREMEVAGGRIRAAHPIHNLLIAALQVISDRREEPGHKLLIWRDVVSLARTSDPAATALVARRTGLDWYLAFVLRQLPSFASPVELARALGHAEAPAGDRFRLRRLIPPGIGARHQIAQVFRLPVPNATAFLAGYLFPSRRFLELRFGSRVAYWAWWRDAVLRLRDAGYPLVDGGDETATGDGARAATQEETR
jgi:hypothetical protein